MADVIDFPRGPKLPPPVDVWDQRTRPLDVQYTLAVLQKQLPADALRHVAGLELERIARAVLLEIDTVRHGRRFDPRYDERRAGGEALALAELFGGPARAAEPPRGGLPPASGSDGSSWTMSREAAALEELFSGARRPEEPVPPDCA